MNHRIILLALFACLSQSIQAAQFAGKIIAIHDGDTATLLTPAKVQMKLRLDQIDAPELAQPFGQVSKQSLAQLIFGKQVIVTVTKKDLYGRYIATIYLANQNINLIQVRRGLAWAYRQYVREQIYITTETYAKTHRLGLWIQPNPVAPWIYRHPITNLPTKPTTPAPKTFSCSVVKKVCKAMSSVQEAYFYLNQCGVKSLDRDKDGIPCEAL
jgi:endonuclease YncB( thermonuclease family)